MGAWTSTFTIGISNRLYPSFLQFKDTFQSTYVEDTRFELVEPFPIRMFSKHMV